jgi:hypothetical protein
MPPMPSRRGCIKTVRSNPVRGWPADRIARGIQRTVSITHLPCALPMQSGTVPVVRRRARLNAPWRHSRGTEPSVFRLNQAAFSVNQAAPSERFSARRLFRGRVFLGPAITRTGAAPNPCCRCSTLPGRETPATAAEPPPEITGPQVSGTDDARFCWIGYVIAL